MTVNQIQYFLEVANTLNFSEAARLLYMTQPALGRQITALESELNMQLFYRSTHGLKLTPSGLYLANKWTQLMEGLDASILHAHQINRGYDSELKIGILEGVNASLFLGEPLSIFEKSFPNVKLCLKRYGFRELRKKLNEKKLDVILTYSMDIVGMPDIDFVNLGSLTPAWAVPISNPIAQKDQVSFLDFKDQELVITNEEDAPFGKETIIKSCLKYGGFYPLFFEVGSVEETILYVEMCNKCAILNMELLIAKSDKVKMFPTGENVDFFYAMAWKNDNTNIGLQLFQTIIKK